MTAKLLLIGSAPLDTAEEVFTAFGPPLGAHLFAIPDGEVGDRRWWVARLHHQVFNGHPDLLTVSRPASEDGVERLIPRGRGDMWKFKVRDGVQTLRFGNPGWRLGFARDALNSYFVFKTLRAQKIVPEHLRFQVSIPLVNSVVTPLLFPEPGDVERVKPGYEAALAAEIGTILDKIPHRDLALQWDCSREITDVYGGIPGLLAEGAIERNIGQIARLSRLVPPEVTLGIHLCFGTFGGWPRFAPDDLGAAIDLSNAMIEAAGRRVDWIHIPTLDTTAESFYAPLKALRMPADTQVYLGVIHSMKSFETRIAVARKFLPEFGLAAYCGFGRLAPAEIPGIIADHVEAVRLFEKTR